MRPAVHSMPLTAHMPDSAAADELHQLPFGEVVPGTDSYLIVRVGREQFGLPLESVAEALDAPVILDVAGMDGRPSSYVEWRGRRLPLIAGRAPFGVESELPCAVALILMDPEQPLAIAVDELCEVRELPPSALRPFAGRTDEHRVVRSVALEGQSFIAIVNPTALRAAILAETPTAASLSVSVADLAERIM